MLKQSDLDKYDSKKMYVVYDNWPDIAKKAYFGINSKINFGKIDHIVFAGMGGSGALGDFLAAILSKTDIHVTVVKGYLLPKTVNSKTLVVVTSISGNTVETLTILKTCKKEKYKTIAFFSGGKMEKYCKRYRIKHRKIEQIHSPRVSFTIFLYAMLNILNPILPISNDEIKESILEIKKLGELINSRNLNEKNPGPWRPARPTWPGWRWRPPRSEGEGKGGARRRDPDNVPGKRFCKTGVGALTTVSGLHVDRTEERVDEQRVARREAEERDCDAQADQHQRRVGDGIHLVPELDVEDDLANCEGHHREGNAVQDREHTTG